MTPATMVMRSVPTKRYVGTAKTTPASRTPRRFRMVMTIRMPMQRETVCGSKLGNGRDQGADSGGNAHGDGENVIGEQRGRGQQARARAQVESRHRVGAAARRIRGDGLAIGKIHDHQQRDDGGADGNDVANAQQAQRNQKAERGFRPVGGGAQRVQTEDRDAFGGSDLLGALVAGLDGLADNEVE